MSVTLKQKPNGIYYIDTQLPDGDGGLKRARISFDTRDKASAEAQRRDWLAGVHPKHPAMGGVVAPKGRKERSDTSTGSTPRQGRGTTVSQWLTRCLNDEAVWGSKRAQRTHTSNARVLGRFLDGVLLTELTNGRIEELNQTLKDSGYANASRRKLLGALQVACRRAVKVGELALLPEFPVVEVHNFQDRVVSVDEEAAMWECLKKRQEDEPLRAWWHFERLLILLLDTGFRLGEGLGCGPSSVKRKRWFDHKGRVQEGTWLSLPRGTTKSMKPREVPCTSRVLGIIPELNERAAKGRWFPWPHGSSGPLYLLQCLRADMAERGFAFDDVKLHTMRHTCATRLAEGGMDLVSLRDWLGHSDISITAARYVHLMNGHIYKGAGILDAYTPGTVGDNGGNEEEDGTELSMVDIQPNGTDRAEVGTVAVH